MKESDIKRRFLQGPPCRSADSGGGRVGRLRLHWKGFMISSRFRSIIYIFSLLKGIITVLPKQNQETTFTVELS